MDSKNCCDNDYRYATTMHCMKQMKIQNIISADDYNKLEEIFTKNYRPTFRLYRENGIRK